MPWLNLYVICVNVGLFILVGIDKRRAKKQLYRISERTLLVIGLLGGGLGGWLAMMVFHHKTRKMKFHLVYGLGMILVMLFLLKSSIITKSLWEGMIG